MTFIGKHQPESRKDERRSTKDKVRSTKDERRKGERRKGERRKGAVGTTRKPAQSQPFSLPFSGGCFSPASRYEVHQASGTGNPPNAHPSQSCINTPMCLHPSQPQPQPQCLLSGPALKGARCHRGFRSAGQGQNSRCLSCRGY